MKTHRIQSIQVYVIVLLCSCLSFGSEQGKMKHERHASDDGVHTCWGVGADIDSRNVGLHGRLWLNDVVGFDLMGYLNWPSTGSGAGTMAEVMYKPPFEIAFRPYILGGIGYNSHKIDTSFNGDPFKKLF